MPTGKRYTYEKICVQCGVRFPTYHGKQQCCSHACKRKWMERRVSIVCKGCGKIFEVIPSKGYQVYCTRECYMNSHEKKEEHREAKANLIFTLANLAKSGYIIDTCDNCQCVIPPNREVKLCDKCERILTAADKRATLDS